MADRKRWMRWALYAVQLLLLFVLQETPGLLPPVMGAKPMLILAAALTIAMVEDCVPAMAFGILRACSPISAAAARWATTRSFSACSAFC